MPEINHKKVDYFLNCEFDGAEISTAVLRQELIGDAGIGSGNRFLDSESEAWKDDDEIPSISDKKFGKGKKDLPDNGYKDPPPLEIKSDAVEKANEVTEAAKLRFDNIEAFLHFLNQTHAPDGAFTYPGIKLKPYVEIGMSKLSEQVAFALASLVITHSRCLKENLNSGEQEHAKEIIARSILND